MTESNGNWRIGRRGVVLGALAAPAIIRTSRAQEAALGPYREAKIDWKQAAGETVNVAMIPTTFYAGLLALAPEFEALTGIKLTAENIPPGQIRNKTVLDLSSKTGPYSASFTDPMHSRLSASNSWVVPTDELAGDPKLTDPAWYALDDVVPAWRAANPYNGKLY